MASKRGSMVLLFFLLACLCLGLRPQHDFYLSLTELTYDPEWGHYTGKVKIFSDNLHDALQAEELLDQELIFEEARVHPLPMLARYLGQHLHFRGEKLALPMLLTGASVLGDAHWIKVEIGQECGAQSLHVENRILLDHIDEQVNILRVRVGGEEYMKSFDQRLSRGSLRW